MRRLSALVATLVCGFPPVAGAVYGGKPVRVRSAPWAVAVVQKLPNGHGFLCSGSILDATHVVTAAHCVFDDRGALAAPETLLVRAGTSNALAGASGQERPAAAVRVHPGYTFDRELHATADDVAVLTLGAALDLSDPAVQPVSLPRPGRRFPANEKFRFAGFGAKAPGARSDGVLSSASGTISEQGVCVDGRNPLMRQANAVVLCAVAPESGSCEADSGGGLVATESHELLGVLNGGECAARGAMQSANVSAPEILSFIRGDEHPPAAPRALPGTFVRLEVTGPALTCSSGGWSGSPRLTYAFVSRLDGRVLQQGTRRAFRLNGRPWVGIACRVTATTAGGSAVLVSSLASPSPRPITRLSLAPPRTAVDAHPGATVAIAVGVSLLVTTPFTGRFGMCVEPPHSLAPRACSTRNVRGRPSGFYPLTVKVRVPAGAKPGLVRAPLSVFAGSAVEHGSVEIRVLAD